MTDRDWRPLTTIDGATAAKIRKLTAEVEQLRAALSHCAAQAGPESCADVLSKVERITKERDEAVHNTAERIAAWLALRDTTVEQAQTFGRPVPAWHGLPTLLADAIRAGAWRKDGGE